MVTHAILVYKFGENDTGLVCRVRNNTGVIIYEYLRAFIEVVGKCEGETGKFTRFPFRCIYIGVRWRRRDDVTSIPCPPAAAAGAGRAASKYNTPALKIFVYPFILRSLGKYIVTSGSCTV